MSAADEPSPALSSSASVSASSTGTTNPQQRAFETAAPPVRAPATVHQLPSQQPPRKRRRIIISCTECHRRKQKCDRSLPCANCVARKKEDSCRFETGAPTVTSGSRAGNGMPGGDEGGQSAAPKQRRPRTSKYDVDVGVTVRRDSDASRVAVGVGAAVPDAGGGVGASLDSSNINFGYTASGTSTLGFLKKLDDDSESSTAAGAGAPLASLAMGPGARLGDTAYFGTRERYKSLVRQLPARPYIEKLVDVFFKDVNWHYNVSMGPRSETARVVTGTWLACAGRFC